ncbi:cytochrome c-type biogenesis protein CcmH [Bacillus dakarensis]|uniref:cytochrome c-type biogenesis protein CcmH n=1 Tax=Robertmurraya dakarensis TaxID=1926278 RepID=UPI00098191AC|nr:cytochrome c-type biogenesis protein CcmH [Bacillus dakarensis]
MYSKRLLLLIGIFLLAIPVTALANNDYNSKEFQSIISQLDMQGHANDELSTCKVKQMYFEEVAEMLNNGMTESEILQSYVDEYGQAALREPSQDKSGLIAWGMPLAGLGGGSVIVAYWIKKLKGKEKMNEEGDHLKWESEIEKEMLEKIFDEERRKHF